MAERLVGAPNLFMTIDNDRPIHVSPTGRRWLAMSAGGGAHLALQRRLGVRLESRVFTTFVGADTHGAVCGGRGCVVGLHVNVAWQIEFTAGLIARF
jgi:hypothetical protein